MKKRIFAAFVAAVMSVSVISAFAEFDPSKEVAENTVATKTIEAQKVITLNGNKIEAPAFYEKDGVVMLPLRALSEAMGFTVEWQGETGTIILTKGPLYITLNAFADGYTFSRMAPVMLGVAPVLENGVTFVPEAFVTEVLDGAYRTGEGVVEIFDSETKNTALISAVNAESKQLEIVDIVKGEVVLNISEDTPIFDEQANTVKLEELKEGVTIRVDYSEAMTRSIPPQNTPNSIVVLSGSPAAAIPSEEVPAGEAEVLEAYNKEQGTIIVKDSVRDEIVLVFSEATVITDAEGKAIGAEELKKGMKLEIVYGDAMTMSLPPINNPKSIKIIK